MAFCGRTLLPVKPKIPYERTLLLFFAVSGKKTLSVRQESLITELGTEINQFAFEFCREIEGGSPANDGSTTDHLEFVWFWGCTLRWRGGFEVILGHDEDLAGEVFYPPDGFELCLIPAILPGRSVQGSRT